MRYVMLLLSIGAMYSTTLANDDTITAAVSEPVTQTTFERGRQSWRQIQ